MKNFRFEMTKVYSEIPPPPKNWNLVISWHFEYFQFWHPTPPPPPKNWNLAISWHFKYFQFWHPTTPPENWKNWNLATSWHIEYFQFWHPTQPPPTSNWFQPVCTTVQSDLVLVGKCINIKWCVELKQRSSNKFIFVIWNTLRCRHYHIKQIAIFKILGMIQLYSRLAMLVNQKF